MTIFRRNHGPMMSGGGGVILQLIITKPTGTSSAKTALYQGLACTQSSASWSASATVPANRSCFAATASAMTAAELSSVISLSGGGALSRAPSDRALASRSLAADAGRRLASLASTSSGGSLDRVRLRPHVTPRLRDCRRIQRGVGLPSRHSPLAATSQADVRPDPKDGIGRHE
jgi:hypothetical protein